MATAARRWVSWREEADVTRRSRGAPSAAAAGRGIRRTVRPAAPPAAVFALLADWLTAAAPALTPSASGIGERSGEPASGSGGLTGTSRRCFAVAETSVASRAIAPSLPDPSAAMYWWWRCSVADCGWSVTRASLTASDPSRATRFGDARRSESPTEISPRQTSGSSSAAGRPRSRFGSGRVASRAWRMRYASAGPTVTTYSSLPRTTAAATPIGPLVSSPPSRSRWWAIFLFAALIALARQTAMPGRLVVEVVVVDRLGHGLGRLAEPRPGQPAGHEQEQAALRAEGRPDRRLVDDDRVRGVGKAILLGDEAELHLEPYGQVGPRIGSDGRRLAFAREWLVDDRGRGPAVPPERLAGGRIIRAGPGSSGPRHGSHRAPRRRRPAARCCAPGAPGPTMASSASTSRASPSIAATRQAPLAAGTRSATIAAQVVVARARRSSVSSPSPRAASGSRSPIRSIGPRRELIVRSPGSSPGRPSPSRRAGWSPPSRSRRPGGPGRGRRARWSSRKPGAGPRSVGPGGPAGPGRAR